MQELHTCNYWVRAKNQKQDHVRKRKKMENTKFLLVKVPIQTLYFTHSLE
jgi:hypothetical protein